MVGVLLMDGDSNRFWTADKNNEFFPSCDGGVEEVPIQEFKMLRVDWNDDARSFAALVFVDGDSPCEGELVKI